MSLPSPALTPADRKALRALTRGQTMSHELAVRCGVTESTARDRASRLRDLGMITTAYSKGFAFHKLTSAGVRANRS